MKYFIGKNGQQLGPFDEDQVRRMLQSGMCLPADLGWHEGRTDWVPLSQLLNIATPPPPAPVSSKPSKKPALQIDNLARTVGTSYIASIYLSISDIIETNYKPLAIILIIIGTINFFILHHNFWKIIPERFRATTPGKAVGFLFVPFYNFYWAFITWPKMAEGVKEWRSSLGYSTPTELDVLATVYAGLFVGSFVAVLISPMLSILVDGASLAFFFLFYYKTAAAINEIAEVPARNEATT